jgi:ABC-type transporter Mla subunit MlaD
MATYKDVLMLVDKVSQPLQKIAENTEKAQGKLAKMREKLKNVTAGVQTAGAKIGKFAKGVGVAFTAVSAVVATVGSALIRGANQVAEFGDRIDKMSQKIGMSTQSFQEWDYILSQNGGNIENLQMGFKTLTNQISMAGKGSKESAAMFKRLGVSIKDNNGYLRKQDDVFNDTITALQKMGETTERDAIGQKLLGRSFVEMKPLLNQTAESVNELRKKANDMGLILSKEDVDNAKNYKDTMDTFSRFFQAKFATVMMKLMPEFSKTLEDLMQFANENQEVFNTIGTSFQWLVTKALPTVIKVAVWIADAFRTAGSMLGEMIGNILSIPTMLSMAFNTFKTNVTLIFVSISKWISEIVQKIQLIAAKIPGIGKIMSGISRITQTQNNTTNTTTNNVTNNYGSTYNYGGGGNFMPAYIR